MRNHDDTGHKPARRQTPSYLQLVRTPPVAPAGGGRSDARSRVAIVPLGADGTGDAGDVPSPGTAHVVTPGSDGRLATRPLGDPAVPRLAPATFQDRRQQWPGRDQAPDASARLVCPGCGFGARIDIVDLRSRRLHLSCDRCFRMWQDRVRETDPVSAGRVPR